MFLHLGCMFQRMTTNAYIVHQYLRWFKIEIIPHQRKIRHAIVYLILLLLHRNVYYHAYKQIVITWSRSSGWEPRNVTVGFYKTEKQGKVVPDVIYSMYIVVVTKKFLMCQIMRFSLYCINGSIEGKCIALKNSNNTLQVIKSELYTEEFF